MLSKEMVLNSAPVDKGSKFRQLVERTIEVVDDENHAITKMRAYAFTGCSLIKKIDLPKLQDVPEYAFEKLWELTSADLPEVFALRGAAFNQCFKLTYINLPSVAKLTGTYHFKNCKSLTSLSLPSLGNIKDYCFELCCSLSFIDLSNATDIQSNSFNGFAPDNPCEVLLGLGSTESAFIDSAPWGCKSENVTFISVDGKKFNAVDGWVG